MDLKTYFAEQFELTKAKNAYTTAEMEKYSAQDRQFIEFMQIQYRIDKQSAMRRLDLYNSDLKENKERRQEFQDNLKEIYEKQIQFANNPKEFKKVVYDKGIKQNVVFLQKFDKKAYKNALRGIPKSKRAIERFEMIDKKSRRYLDKSTGKELSRRQAEKIIKEISIEDYLKDLRD